jgi:hypothetical protein
MVNDRQAAVAAHVSPVFVDRRGVSTSLVQAELPDLERTRPLQFEELQSPVIRTAIGYWLSKQDNGAPMRRCHFDPTEVPHLLPYLVLLEVLREPAGRADARKSSDRADATKGGTVTDFRYRVIGDVVGRYSRANYTGKCFSDVEGQGPESEVWRVISTVVEQRRPVLLRPPYVGPHHHIYFCEASVMPMLDEQGDVARLLIAADFLPESWEERHGFSARA